jgi:hypothetical protein
MRLSGHTRLSAATAPAVVTAGVGRTALARQVSQALAGRRLIWCGIRGEDGEALRELPELAGSFSITAPLRDAAGGPLEVDVCLESLRGARPDLDRYDIDLDPTEAARAFRRGVLQSVAEPCVVMTYRPAAMLSALGFAMGATMTLAGPFEGRQAAFEHKPWVESALAARGVRGLGWRYLAVEQHAELRRMVAHRPHVLRASRTSGGEGVRLVRTVEELDGGWAGGGDGLVAAAPFLDGLPINFSGCVFPDGGVRLHPASVQLIGIGSCTDRPFGFCGSDFGALPALCDDATLDRVDALGRQVGAWLRDERYLGAFGVDAIVAGGEVIFTEVNARFQGSSAPSAIVARELGVPDLFLDHLAACLGLPSTWAGLSIRTWARRQPAVSRVVVHNTATTSLARVADAQPLAALRAGEGIAQLPPDLPADPGAALCSATLRRSVTRTGFALDDAAERLVRALRERYAPSGRTTSQPSSAQSSSAVRIASP